MTLITDTHAHLDMKEFDSDRDEVIKRALENGVEKIIAVGVDLASSQKAVELSQKYEEIYAAVGIQPEEINQYFEEAPDPIFFNPRKIKIDVRGELEKLAKNKKVVAIGECGLDYKYIREKGKSPEDQELEKEKQKDIFRRQLGTAVLLDLPVIIHNREADEDIMNEILRYKETKKLSGVFHCFTAEARLSAEALAQAEKVLECGFLISFTGLITYPKNDELRKVIKEIPLEKILVETDSPFLAPQSHRGQRNEPSFVTEVINQIALIKGIDAEKVAEITTQNAKNLFGID